MGTSSSRRQSESAMKPEPFIRLGFFLGIFLLMALWEIWGPRRPLLTSKKGRWFANLALVAIDTLSLRLFLPVLATGVALLAEEEKIGLLNYLGGPFWIKIVLGVIFLDLIIYLQHAMFHALPAFWRLHMMHHTDLDFDTTTGIRFHPLEIFLSMGIKMIAVLGLGVSVPAVVIFEILLNATSLFNHGNVCLPAPFERVLRLFVVTPEMHRVHHSVIIRETNSNFGFNFPWWDRLLGTYRDQPAAGHEGMTIGLSHFRNPGELTLLHLLVLPFTRHPGKYPFAS
jgi:sterol desaturase/sphingolipid hydroxylase (fatty acid hydroxylase superfamily)